MKQRKRNKLQHQVCILFKSQDQYDEFDAYCADKELVKGRFLREAIFEKMERDSMSSLKQA